MGFLPFNRNDYDYRFRTRWGGYRPDLAIIWSEKYVYFSHLFSYANTRTPGSMADQFD